MLENLRAVNSSALADVSKTREDRIRDSGARADDTEFVAEHPVVRTHPETGRKALYVNVAHTQRFVDMTEEESRPLLQYLFEHSVRPEFTCRFQWRVGSLALWDNRCAMHNPINDYHGHTRTMHRITPRRETCPADPRRGESPLSARRSPAHGAREQRRRSRHGAGCARRRWSTVDGGRVDFARCCEPGRRRRARAARVGHRAGDRVAVWAPNSLEWIVAALGVTTAGGVLVPINTRFRGAEAAYVLGAQRRAGALHRARVPRHRLPGAARERRGRAARARAHDPARR